MQRYIIIFIIFAIFCLPISIFAEKVAEKVVEEEEEEYDLGTMTCKELLEDEEVFATMTTWIDGYLSATNKNTKMSNAYMNSLGEQLSDFCSKNPDKTIMNAISALK